MRSFAWLVVAILGWQSPVLAQVQTVNHQTADHKTADHQVTDEVCLAEPHSRDPTFERQQGVLAMLCKSDTEADDRSYLVATAHLGATMTRQGPQTAIARLNPTFAARLASAIREARDSGLPLAGIFSAYRPPDFGVGGFFDKFSSLHAYGLAVDMLGIGVPGSKEAKLWYDIAARHGIVCPYGVDSRAEWNHCQPTPVRIVCPDNPLRTTITAEGPIDLAEMFKIGDWVIETSPPATCLVVAGSRPEDAKAVAHHESRVTLVSAPARVARHASRVALVAAPARMDRRHLHEARKLGHHAFTESKLGRHALAESKLGHHTFAEKRWNDQQLMRMVAADLKLGESSHVRRSRRR